MAKKKSKNEKVILKKDLIRDVTNCVPYNLATVREIYDMFEIRLFKILSLATEDTPVKVKLFDGVSIDSRFYPSVERKNNLTGEIIQMKSKVKPKFTVTQNYIEKLTSGEM